MTDTPTLDPAAWVRSKRHDHRRRGTTPWKVGTVAPRLVGWYDRLFTDGVYRQWWDGKEWRCGKDGVAHWRQVGDYPCWRGLTCMAFIRGKVK
jgi:hypothetical protein